jgi:SNF2 family DNA or RNA helicase
MNFLDSDKWRDLEALEEEYEELSEDLVRQLHVRLKPYFLRRIKSEVLQLPPKVFTSLLECSQLNIYLVRTRLLSHSQ